jgi:hypothetical protein
VTGETVGVDDARATDPEELWRALATVIAGRPRVRVSRDGGRTYPARSERNLTGDLPNAPAAVMLYDEHAAARCLAADFDVARGGQSQVDTDAGAFAALVEACGGRVVTDQSPTGGRHVYVFWARPIPLTELRPVLHALRARFPSLDTAPMLGNRRSIRPAASTAAAGYRRAVRFIHKCEESRPRRRALPETGRRGRGLHASVGVGRILAGGGVGQRVRGHGRDVRGGSGEPGREHSDAHPEPDGEWAGADGG